MASIVGKGMPRWYLGRNPETAQAQLRRGGRAHDRRPASPTTTRTIVRSASANLGDEARGAVEPCRRSARVIVRQLVMGPSVDAPIGVRIFGPRLGAKFADLRRHACQRSRGLKDILRAHRRNLGRARHLGFGGLPARRRGRRGRRRTWPASRTPAWRARSTPTSPATTSRPSARGTTRCRSTCACRPSSAVSWGCSAAAYVEGDQRQGAARRRRRPSVCAGIPARIDRRFLQRVIEVRARAMPGYRANDIVNATLASPEFASLEGERLPPGYWWQIGGELFESMQSKADLQTSITISLLADRDAPDHPVQRHRQADHHPDDAAAGADRRAVRALSPTDNPLSLMAQLGAALAVRDRGQHRDHLPGVRRRRCWRTRSRRATARVRSRGSRSRSSAIAWWRPARCACCRSR